MTFRIVPFLRLKHIRGFDFAVYIHKASAGIVQIIGQNMQHLLRITFGFEIVLKEWIRITPVNIQEKIHASKAWHEVDIIVNRTEEIL